MLVHIERIVEEYLHWEMCGEPRPKGRFQLYAVEGGTAAMCYTFKALKMKHFGCTGWRLGVIAVHEGNVFDKLIGRHPEAIQKQFEKRYSSLTLEPRAVKIHRPHRRR
jgi:hypothetical protein